MAQHAHDHDHGELHFLHTEVSDGTLAQVRESHAPLADVLDLTRRWATLTDDEKKDAATKQELVEKHPGWMPGYHAEGDRCGTCRMPTLPLFTDKLQEGDLVYGAFLSGLPVHPTAACLDGFDAAQPDTSPRGLDQARRGLVREMERPSPRMAQFLRHDLLAHPPFGLEDWTNSVAAANPQGLSRTSRKDMERLVRYVHERLFHA